MNAAECAELAAIRNSAAALEARLARVEDMLERLARADAVLRRAALPASLTRPRVTNRLFVTPRPGHLCPVKQGDKS